MDDVTYTKRGQAETRQRNRAGKKKAARKTNEVLVVTAALIENILEQGRVAAYPASIWAVPEHEHACVLFVGYHEKRKKKETRGNARFCATNGKQKENIPGGGAMGIAQYRAVRE